MDEEKYVIVETGGSIGEIDKRGHTRLASFHIYCDKDAAKRRCRSLSKDFGGGYYNYHYRTVTLAWAKKNLRESELRNLK